MGFLIKWISVFCGQSLSYQVLRVPYLHRSLNCIYACTCICNVYAHVRCCSLSHVESIDKSKQVHPDNRHMLEYLYLFLKWEFLFKLFAQSHLSLCWAFRSHEVIMNIFPFCNQFSDCICKCGTQLQYLRSHQVYVLFFSDHSC